MWQFLARDRDCTEMPDAATNAGLCLVDPCCDVQLILAIIQLRTSGLPVYLDMANVTANASGATSVPPRRLAGPRQQFLGFAALLGCACSYRQL